MYLSPVFQENQFTDNVEFLVGGLLWTYKAGTSEFALTYQDQSGNTPWPNPIILNSRGETGGELWLSSDNEYRLVVETAPEYGQTHGVVITEFDNVSGVNAPATESADNWVLFSEAPNYVSNTSFTVAGDYRSIFVTNRKLQITDTGGVSVHSVTSSSFAAGFTTVNITGLTDSGISLVEYSSISPDASPDRFTDLTLTGDLTVGDGAVIDGNLVVGGDTTLSGNLNSIPIADYWTDVNNTFGTSTSPSAGYINFANGLKIYRETFTVSWPSGATIVDGTKNFSSPMPTACLQVVACFGNIVDVALDNYSPIIFIPSVTASGFTYSLRSTTGTAGTTSVEVRFIAIGY